MRPDAAGGPPDSSGLPIHCELTTVGEPACKRPAVVRIVGSYGGAAPGCEIHGVRALRAIRDAWVHPLPGQDGAAIAVYLAARGTGRPTPSQSDQEHEDDRGGQPDSGGLPSGSPFRPLPRSFREEPTVMTTTSEPFTPPAVHASVAAVPTVIEQAMRRSAVNYYRALNLPLDTYTDQAARAARLAAACADRAACWAALARWATSSDRAVPWPLVSAVTSARRREDDAARFWRETAGYWRRVAAGADPRQLDAEDLDLHDEWARWAS
jgi:hypothetical protein